MNFKYEFLTGETIEVELGESFRQIMQELNRKEHNNNRTESRRHVSIEGLQEKGINLNHKGSDIGEELGKRESIKELHNALEYLLPEQRKLISNIFVKNLSVAEICRMEGVSEAAIRNRLKKIYKKLKKFLK